MLSALELTLCCRWPVSDSLALFHFLSSVEFTASIDAATPELDAEESISPVYGEGARMRRGMVWW